MSRELLLLRHGKSDWSIETEDFNRPLKQRGKKAALRVGEWMQRQNLTPDWVISSPAVRALKTAEKVCEALRLNSGKIALDERIYQADVEKLKTVLAGCPELTRRVLLVGHNPELEGLLNYLVEGIVMPKDGKLMATATLARLQMPENWHELDRYCAKLLFITRVKDMAVNNFPKQ